MNWRKLNGEILTLDIHQAVEATIESERARGYNLKVCIGSDSQVYPDHT